MQVNLFQMSRDERVAFFINIYNALVVHAMAMFGPAESTLKRCARNVSTLMSLVATSRCRGLVPLKV